jgi:hypothetical protein
LAEGSTFRVDASNVAANACKQTWRNEQARRRSVALKLNTPDEFEVAFALDWWDAIHLVQRSTATSGTAMAHTTMRPH